MSNLFNTLKSLMYVFNIFFIFNKNVKKPGIVELGGTPKAKDESEHRQLQVIQ